MRHAICAASLALVAACSRGRGESAPAPSASASAPALALGEPITSPLLSLADIAQDPGRYANRVVATSGKVVAVCQEMGCWLDLQDASGRAHVRMHGHSFFVPRTAPGHTARVQAKVVKQAGATDGCEDQACADKQGAAKIELDATGVEID